MRIWQLGFTAGLFLTACGDAEKNSATPEKNTSQETTTSSPPPVKDVGEEIANVNGVSIGEKDFQRAAARKIPANGKSLSPEERAEIINQLIDEELLYQKSFEQKLFRDAKVKKVMMNALLREQVYSKVKGTDISEDELRSYYDSHKEDFVIPEKVQIQRILIKIKADQDEATAQAKAQRIYDRLSGNADKFKSVAEELSEGPYARRGGDVGFVSSKGKPGLVQEVVDKAFAMKKGELSKPFVTKDGVNIIYVKERREEQVRSFKTAQGTVMRKMKNEKISETYKSYTESLRTGADVNIETEKVNAIEVKSSPKPTLRGPGGPTMKLPK